MPIATQADLEKFLQIDITSEPSAPVTMLLENATGLVEAFLGRNLQLASYDEKYDPPTGATLVLNNAPIDTATNPIVVTQDGTLLVLDTDYYIQKELGAVRRITPNGTLRRWAVTSWKPNSIRVQYDAGFDFTQNPLLNREALTARDTVTRIVARAWQAAAAYANLPTASDAIKSVTLAGSDSVTYRDELTNVASSALQFTDDDRSALNHIRRRLLV